MAEPQLLYKDNSLPLETPDEKGWVEGYASVYDVVDSQKDAVDRGAFAKALLNPGKIKFLWQHDYKRPIGRIHKLWDDEKGLKYRARYNLKTSWGRDAYEAAVNQDIDGNSIGYDLRNGKAFKDDDGVQHLSDINLWEVSNVTFPSNVEATNTSVKSDDNMNPEEMKGVIGYKKTPLAPESTAWDGPAQTSGTSVDVLKIICAWFDSENADNATAYKMPHHLASGDHSCVWNGVRAALASLGGARGSKPSIPPTDIAGVRAHLEHHAADFGKDVGKMYADLFYKLDELELETDVKQGRVLSAKNESDLRDAHGSLKDAHTKIAGVLKQVTGKAPSEDVPGDTSTAAPPVAPDDGNGKSAAESEAIKLKLTEILNLVKSKS